MGNQTPRPLIIVYFDLGIGGVQRKIVDIVNDLAIHRAHTSVYLLLENSKNNTLVSQLHNANAHVVYKPFSRMPFWAFIFWYVVWKNPRVILSFLTLPSLYASQAIHAIFWRKIKLIIGQDVITSLALKRGDFSQEINTQISQTYSRAEAILTPTKIIADDLIRAYHVSPKRLHVIPNWTTIAREVRTHAKGFDCIYVGRFDKEKRLTLLLSIIAKLKKRLPDISVLLVGEGRQKERLVHNIKSLRLENNITLKTPMAHIQPIIAQAKIAVCTSESEGTPMFLLEAMALGLPVVTTNYPGVSALVIHNKSGCICTSQTRYAEALRRLLSNGSLRTSMGNFGKQVIAMSYSTKNIQQYVGYLFSSYD